MVACHWERKLGGNPDVTDADLLHFDEEFLTRYTKADREKVKTYMLSPARECSKDQSAQETQVAK